MQNDYEALETIKQQSLFFGMSHINKTVHFYAEISVRIVAIAEQRFVLKSGLLAFDVNSNSSIK